MRSMSLVGIYTGYLNEEKLVPVLAGIYISIQMGDCIWIISSLTI